MPRFPATLLAVLMAGGTASAQVDDSLATLQARLNEAFDSSGEFDWELDRTTAIVDSMLLLPPATRQSSAPVFKLAKLFLCTGQSEHARTYFGKYLQHPRSNANGRKLAQFWLDALRRSDSIDAQLPRVKDPRDGRTYRTVKIGPQTWMAENLAWNAPGSVCSQDQETWCRTYGRYYDLASVRTACMPGWRLPTEADWNRLLELHPDPRALKGPELGGNNASGFHALPGGLSERILLGGKYGFASSSRSQTGVFWEAPGADSALFSRIGEAVTNPYGDEDDDRIVPEDGSDAFERAPGSATTFKNVRCIQ